MKGNIGYRKTDFGNETPDILDKYVLKDTKIADIPLKKDITVEGLKTALGVNELVDELHNEVTVRSKTDAELAVEIGQKNNLKEMALSALKNKDNDYYTLPFKEGDFFVLYNDSDDTVSYLTYEYNDDWYNPEAYYSLSTPIKAGERGLCCFKKNFVDVGDVDGSTTAYILCTPLAVDSKLDENSNNPVRNKVVKNALDTLAEENKVVSAEIANLEKRVDNAEYNADLLSQGFYAHQTDENNPHNVTKTQIGLGNVDNTADIDKPISTATQTALDALERNIDENNSPIQFSQFIVAESRTDVPFISSYDKSTGTITLNSNGVMSNWSIGNSYEKCFSFEIGDVSVPVIFAQDNDKYYYLNIGYNSALKYFACFQSITKTTSAENFICIKNTYLERHFEKGEKILMTITPNITVTVNGNTKIVNRYIAYRKRITDVKFRQFVVFDMDTSVTPVLGFYSYGQLSNVLIKGLYIDIDMPEYPVYNGATLINSGKNDSVLEYSAKKWLAIGDSITGFGEASWGDGAVDATDDDTENATYGINYIHFVEAMTGYQACRTATGNNYGYSGYALGGSGDHGKATLYGRLSDWDDVQTNLVTLFAGTNDYLYGTEIGTMDDYIGNTGIDTIYGALRLYIDYFKTKGINDELDIVLITPIQRFDDWSRDVANDKGYYLSDYVNAIKTVGAYESLLVVDLYNDGGIGQHNYKKVLKGDYLHPNKQGYEIIAKRICAAFKYGNTHAVADLGESRIGNIENDYIHATTPTQIGTWLDGTPIWRVSFENSHAFSVDTVENGYQTYDLNDNVLAGVVSDTDATSIIGAFVASICGARTFNDTVSMTYFNSGIAYFSLDGIGETGSGYNGVYGYVDFITTESNIN